MTPWTRPAVTPAKIERPSLRERAVGLGKGLGEHFIDYAIAGTVISVAGSGVAGGRLSGLIGVGAFVALSLISGLCGAVRPRKQTESPAETARATYQYTPRAVEPIAPAQSFLQSRIADAAALVNNDLTRSATVLVVATGLSMAGLHAIDWPASWQIALIPGLLFTLGVSVGSRHFKASPRDSSQPQNASM